MLQGDLHMPLSGIGELAVTLLLVGVIWLAGAVYIRAADHYVQTRRAPARRPRRDP
jgi:hypothetical protein